ncbi:MAG: PEGA domain-containing protein [Candidatus Korobacteraceae bacterium]
MHTSFRLASVMFLCIAVVTAPIATAQQASPPPATTAANHSFTLDDGTPIKLRLDRNLSSADEKTGDNVDFEVHVKLADGEKAAIRAVKETKGGGHTGAMTGAIVATSLVVWPAAPFFLFMHGKDTTIPKGTEITAYVNGNMPLDPVKFAPVAPATSSVARSPAETSQDTPTTNAQLEITSNPVGAEISVDGNFVGDTPSELAVTPGVHTIAIAKHGYKQWERRLTVPGGKVTVLADLER